MFITHAALQLELGRDDPNLVPKDLFTTDAPL